jgi:prepilin-type processing-associated H-X9-DG protein
MGGEAGYFRPIKKLSQTSDPSPSEKSVLWDEDSRSIDNGGFGINPPITWAWFNLPASRHGKKGIMSYVDGHVEGWKWLDSSVLAIGVPEPPVGSGMAIPGPVPQTDRDLPRVERTTKVWP